MPMTHRERILATMRQQPVDRFPVWLKAANRTWQNAQPDPCRSMSGRDLLSAMGCDIMDGGMAPVATVRPHVRVETSDDGQVLTTVTHTPDGDLVERERLDPPTGTRHPVGYAVHDRSTLERLRWVYADARHVPADSPKRDEARRRYEAGVAADAVMMCGVGPGPLMDMVEHWCGPENAIYLLHDEPEAFAETLSLMHAARVKQLRAMLASAPMDMLWLTENTSTTLLSPTIFQAHCVPHLRVYGDLILEAGVIPVHHMCGKLHALLEAIDALPALANEAYTTPPVGDTTLAEGRRRLRSKALIGGTNAALWLRPVEDIIAEVAADLAACPDRRGIMLTSAGVLPPRVDFDKARHVVDAFKRLPCG